MSFWTRHILSTEKLLTVVVTILVEMKNVSVFTATLKRLRLLSLKLSRTTTPNTVEEPHLTLW